MDLVKVGIRQFREKLASYVLEGERPVAVTRHGDTVGYFVPTRKKRSVAEREALQEAAARLDAALAAKGVTEEEMVRAFRSRRAVPRK